MFVSFDSRYFVGFVIALGIVYLATTGFSTGLGAKLVHAHIFGRVVLLLQWDCISPYLYVVHVNSYRQPNINRIPR